jgi:multimeric flavodoxin WrbA
MHITAIYGSPRKNGNTDMLLESFVRGARSAGCEPDEITLRDLAFIPCIECGGCDTTGVCVIRDDMDRVYPRLVESDGVVLAAPVFFYGLNALAKAMVDRCQCLYVRKYVLHTTAGNADRIRRNGYLLTAGGSRGAKNFDGILLTARYFFDALDCDFAGHLAFRGIDAPGSIRSHPSALDEAYQLGRVLTGAPDAIVRS